MVKFMENLSKSECKPLRKYIHLEEANPIHRYTYVFIAYLPYNKTSGYKSECKYDYGDSQWQKMSKRFLFCPII